MGVFIRATAILLLSTFITLQAGCRQLPMSADNGRRLLATPPPKAEKMMTGPTFKFNGTHVQLPFAPPGFNGTIVCPKNATRPPAPPAPPAPPLASLRSGARPPHGAEPPRPPRGARPPAPPGMLPFPGGGGPHGGPEGGPHGGPHGGHGPPEPTLVNVTGALNASMPILAYNGTGPMPHPCPGMDGPGGHGGPHGGPFDGPGGFRMAPPGSLLAMMGGPGGFGGPEDGPGGGRGGPDGGGDGPGGAMGGGPGGRGGPGGEVGGFGH